jgi:hypothetical protein
MDAEHALTELGLSGIADADSLRRAYLRKVRAHSPERDPEGFQRVRAAYDFLRDNPWLWPSLAPVEPAPIEPAPVEPAPVEPAPVEPAPVEAAPVEAAPVEAAPVESSDAADEPVAMDTAPGSSGAGGGGSAPAPSVEIEAEARAPERVHSVREIVRTPALDSLFQKWIDVHDARALDDPEGTARTMIELFGARVVGAETPLPGPEATFQLALVLFEKHEAQLAGELLSAFEERSRADGSSHGLSSASAACHKLLRELFALRGLAPRRLTALLARSVREGEPPSDTKAIEEAVLFVGPGFWEAFAQRAPTLFAMLRPFLPKAKATATARAAVNAGFHRFGWWIPVLVVLQFVRLIPQCSSATEPPRRSDDPARYADPASNADALVLSTLEDSIDGALARKDCAPLLRDFETYKVALRYGASDGDKLRSFMERQRQAMDICPALSTRLSGAP